MSNAGVGNRRVLTEDIDPVPVGGDRAPQIDTKIIAIDGQTGERELDAAIAELTDVDELISREAARRRVHGGEDAIPCELAVIRELDREAILQQTGVETRFQLPSDFGPQIGITDTERRNGRRASGSDRWSIRLNGRERVRLLPGLAPRRPQLQRGQQRRFREERLFGKHPARAEFWVDDEIVVDTECAVVVPAHGTSEEEAIAPGELFLQVGAEGLVLEVEVRILETLPESAAAHGVDAANRETAARS